MSKGLFPMEEWDSAYQKDYERLYAKGYRGIIFDIDNTLVFHGAPVNEKAIFLIRELKQLGFSIFFLSNNKEQRVKDFCEPLEVPYLWKAGKPKIEGYRKACEQMKLKRGQVVSIGDQIFTDTWGANRAGIYSVLVRPLGKKEEIQIVAKRLLERPLLYFYRKRKRSSKA